MTKYNELEREVARVREHPPSARDLRRRLGWADTSEARQEANLKHNCTHGPLNAELEAEVDRILNLKLDERDPDKLMCVFCEGTSDTIHELHARIVRQRDRIAEQLAELTEARAVHEQDVAQRWDLERKNEKLRAMLEQRTREKLALVGEIETLEKKDRP